MVQVSRTTSITKIQITTHKCNRIDQKQNKKKANSKVEIIEHGDAWEGKKQDNIANEAAC